LTPISRYRTQLGISLRVVRAILRSPALRRVEFAFLLFNAVEFGTWVAILLYAYEVIGPATVGLVALVQLVPAAIVAPLSSNLADRFPRDRVLLVGYLIQVAAFGSTWIGMAIGAAPALVIIAAACAVTSLTVTRPTQGALIPSLARTPEELTAANGLSGTIEGAGMLLGPLLAAAILAVATPTAVFGAATAASLAAATLVIHLPAPRSPVVVRAEPEPVAPTYRGGLLEGVRLVAHHGNTRLVVGILSLRMFVTGALDILLVGAITFTFVGRQRLAPALAVAAVASGLALVVVGTVAPVWAAAPLIALTGIGWAGCDVVGRTILQRVTADLVLARVLGVLEGLGLASLALGAVLAPVIVLAVGVQGAIVVAGVLLPAGIALSWLGLRAMDRISLVPRRALDLLRAVEIFAPLPPPQLEWVARHVRWITIDQGMVLIAEGDAGDAYYVLESGALTVTRGGELLRVLTARADAVGEIALLRDVPRTATVTTSAESIMLMLSRADFLEAVTGHLQSHEVARRVVEARP